MVFRYTLYDVRDNNKPVLVDVKNSELCSFLGIKSFSYVSYCRNGKLYRGTYKIVQKVDGEEVQRLATYSEEFRRKWEKECEWYRNFDWRQTWSKGVKRLVSGGKR